MSIMSMMEELLVFIQISLLFIRFVKFFLLEREIGLFRSDDSTNQP